MTKDHTAMMQYQRQRLAKHIRQDIMTIQEKIEIVVSMNGEDRTKALHFLMSIIATSNMNDDLTKALADYQLESLSL